MVERNVSDIQQPLELILDGSAISIRDVVSVALKHRAAHLSSTDQVKTRIAASASLVEQAVEENWQVYGVTTGFGGMADVPVPPGLAASSQENLIMLMAAGAGQPIAKRHVRAAMLLRANVLARGDSGIRLELIQQLISFLEADAIPVVREYGSVGASGDLIPLASIARAICGRTRRSMVQMGDRLVDGESAVFELGLKPISLRAKEGLALVNGTSFSSAVAANCIHDAQQLLGLTMGIQALMLRALNVQVEAFHPFIHDRKPHPGQVLAAKVIRNLLAIESSQYDSEGNGHVQDRYSLRCLPQYIGPMIEGMARLAKVVETEMNSVSDNPLADVEEAVFRGGGNFLGQYIGIGMDDLRRYIGLMAKHLDVQIAQLVSPEFSRGLTASLRGNDNLAYNMGLKGLQITGNSIMPHLTYMGNPLVEHFPTHAEQYNQNVNGLSWGSANMTWRAVELYRQYCAISLIFAIQSLDMRAKQALGHYDGRSLLGEELQRLYVSTCDALGTLPTPERPFLFDDSDHWMENVIESLVADIEADGPIIQAVQPVLDTLRFDTLNNLSGSNDCIGD